MLVLWMQTLTLLEGQGLSIQATIFHCSCAKAASDDSGGNQVLDNLLTFVFSGNESTCTVTNSLVLLLTIYRCGGRHTSRKADHVVARRVLEIHSSA